MMLKAATTGATAGVTGAEIYFKVVPAGTAAPQPLGPGQVPLSPAQIPRSDRKSVV